MLQKAYTREYSCHSSVLQNEIGRLIINKDEIPKRWNRYFKNCLMKKNSIQVTGNEDSTSKR